MTDAAHKNLIKRILVPVDFSEASGKALEYALWFAARMGATVQALHVWQVPDLAGGKLIFVDGEIRQPIAEWRKEQAERELAQFLEKAGATDKVESLLRRGNPADVIHTTSAQENSDLIVMGTTGRSGLPRIVLGSVAEKTVRTSLCPVMTVRIDS